MSCGLFLHAAVLLLLPPLLLGVIQRVKAFFAGRTGVHLFQLYYDLAKLARKDLVLSRTTTWIFVAAPGAALVAMLAAGMLLPFGPCASPCGFTGDFILLLYLFGLARFVTTLAALDTGSAFEGMGVAREITFSALAEPALFLAMLTLAKATAAAYALTASGLAVVLLAENSRIPVDDPATHLELTMVHEAMVLDHSGPLLGLILYGASIKYFLFTTLLLHVLGLADGDGGALSWGLFLSGTVLVAAGVGVVESMMARLQLRHVPTLLTSASLLCGFALLLVLR